MQQADFVNFDFEVLVVMAIFGSHQIAACRNKTNFHQIRVTLRKESRQ